jgi:hypothetical protein
VRTIDGLIQIASVVFGVPRTPTVLEMANQIEALGEDERAARFEANVSKLSTVEFNAGAVLRGQGKRPPTGNIIAANDARLRVFYESIEWRRLSYDVKIERGRRCECCGATPATGARIITDHIKPIRKYWHLRLQRSNLQVLCDDCNLGKGSRDETDFREETQVSEPVVVLSRADVESAKTDAGGWTRAQLAEWGVPWPPPEGWKKKLLETAGIPEHDDSQLTPPPGWP